MELRKFAIVAAAAVCAVALPAQAKTPACFNAGDVAQHWGVASPREIYFRTLDRSGHFSSATYAVRTADACPALNIASQARDGRPAQYSLFVAAGRNNIACRAAEVRIVGDKGPCVPVSLRRLSPTEAAALPDEVWKR